MDTPIFLDIGDILEMHAEQLELYGGREGIRDQGSLESAIAQPSSGMFGQFLHEDLSSMAAAYVFHISQNQPFVDGNKRTGTIAAITFLKLNGLELQVEELELADMVLRMGCGELTKTDIAAYFRANVRTIANP